MFMARIGVYNDPRANQCSIAMPGKQSVNQFEVRRVLSAFASFCGVITSSKANFKLPNNTTEYKTGENALVPAACH